LDTDVGSSSALAALEFSRQISHVKSTPGGKGDNCGERAQCCGEGDGSCQTSVNAR